MRTDSREKPGHNPSLASLEKSLEEEVLRGLYRTANHFQRAIEQVVKPQGLTPKQYTVLRILRDAGEEGMRCAEIAVQQTSSDPDITRLLDRLVRQKLIRRRRGSSDRRIVVAYITEAGLMKVENSEPLVKAAITYAMKHLKTKQLQELISLLQAARSKSDGL